VLGKPSTDFFALAAGSLGVSIQECVVVGDDATTDIAGGREAGARTVQVRTGKYAVPAMQLVSVSGSAIVFHIGIGACDKDARGLVSESVELIVIGGVRDTTGCRSVLHPCSRSSPG
jgi:ribonucleotide monophosphatase NagD (HAD superfamily)